VPEALLKAGEMNRKLGNREAAKQVLRSLIQSYPASSQVLTARLYIGELYAEEGQIELAEEEARRVSGSNASPGVRNAASYAIAKFQTGGSMFTNAETTLTGLLKTKPGAAVAFAATLDLAGIELITGRPKPAADRLRSLLSVKDIEDSLKVEALVRLGEAQFDQGQFSGAEESWSKVHTQYPGHSLAPFARIRSAGAANREGKYRRALAYLAPVTSSDRPDYRKAALTGSAEAALGMKRPSEAARYLKQHRVEFPGDTSALQLMLRLGEAYHAVANDCKNALKIFEQLGEEGSSSPYADDALYLAARCEEELGDVADAVATFTNLQMRYPAHDRYDEVRSAIDFLETHRIKNRDVGIGKLSSARYTSRT
jgi:TolA-binding protein